MGTVGCGWAGTWRGWHQVAPRCGDTDGAVGTRTVLLAHVGCGVALRGRCQHQHIRGRISLGTPLSPVTALWGHHQHWNIHGHGSFGTVPASVTHESHGSLGTPLTSSNTHRSQLSGDSTSISTHMGTGLWRHHCHKVTHKGRGSQTPPAPMTHVGHGSLGTRPGLAHPRTQPSGDTTVTSDTRGSQLPGDIASAGDTQDHRDS